MAMVRGNASIIHSCGIGTRGQATGGIPMVKSQSWSLVCSSSAPSRSGTSRSGYGLKLGRGGGCARKVVVSRSSGGGRKNKQREEKLSRENVTPAYPPPPPTPATSNPFGIRKEDAGVEEPAAAAEAEAEAEAEAVADDVEAEASASGLLESQSGKDDELEATRNGSTDAESESAKDIRKASESELSRARAVLRSQDQDPALTTDFWKGVIQETKLIEWPAFSRILGTTRVVVAMIVGSSVVLLTVNAVLAATSEYLLNDPGFRSVVETYLKLSF